MYTSETKPKQTNIVSPNFSGSVVPLLLLPAYPSPCTSAGCLYQVGERCILIPYRAEHVPTYHEWMQQQQMLDLTASERMTLEQEYSNQQSWTLDPTSQPTHLIYVHSHSLPASSPCLTVAFCCGVER